MVQIPLKILIVEDRNSDLKLILNELKKGVFQFSYEHCQTENKFNDLLIQFVPDIILSDHNLPEFNSTDALIKARKLNPHIPFILVSGYVGENEAVDFIVNKGANDFILKDNLLRLNPAIIREIKNYRLKFELEKKTEELKRLSMVASHTHNGVIITNRNGETEWVNGAFTEISGYTLTECFGQKPGHILQGENTDPNTVARIRAKLKEVKPFREEILNYHKNGSSYWIKLDITPILDGFGQLTNFIAIQEDITENKKNENKLLYTYEQLERAQEIGKIGNWEFDLNTQEVTWSNQVFKIYERDVSLGNPTFEEIKNYHHDEHNKHEISNALEKGEPYDVDTELITKSGEKKYIRTVGIPTKNSLGITVKFTGVVQDITKRKSVEIALYDSQKKLRNITANLPGIVLRYRLYHNGEQSIEFISEGVETLFEINQEQAINDADNLWDVIEPEDVNKTMESIRNSAKTMTLWNAVYRIKTKSGKHKWIQGIGIPFEKNEDYVAWDTMLFDKTKEVEFEHSLKESNERLLEAQKLAQIGDWSINLITGETYVSPLVKKIYEVDHDFVMEEGIKYYKEGFSRDRIHEVVKAAIEHGTPYSEDLLLITGKGNERWVRSQGQAEVKNGKSVRIYGTLMDIDKRKRIEIELQKNNERLIKAQKLAKIGDWSIDFESNETFISPVVKEIHEVEQDFEWDIDTGLTFFKEGFNRRRKEFVINRAVTEGVAYNEELIIVTGKGNERWVRSIGEASFKGGKCVRLNGTIMDINEEKVLKDSLQENQQILDAAISGADLGVWDLNLITGENLTNKLYKESLGYSDDEFEESFEFFLNILHPDDQKNVRSELERIESGGENHVDIIIRLKHKDGNYRTFLDRGRAMDFDENGKVTRMIGTIMDITENVELQESLQQSLDEKVILLSEIHHRVKNNLAIVSGLLDLQAFESKDKLVKDTLLNMGQRIKSIAGVHELLYEGETFSEIKLTEYINNLIENINTTLLNNKKVLFDISIDNSVDININQAVPIGLLLNELVTNSFKYAFHNTENPKIKFHISQIGDSYSAEYSDNGPGINKNKVLNPKSLGTTLINTLLNQLDADFKIMNKNGFNLSFTFKEQSIGAHSNLSK